MKADKGDIKDKRIAEVVREIAGNFVQKESSGASMITITGVVLNDRGKRADIYFTTLPQEKEVVVEEFLNRRRFDFQELLRSKTRIGRLPICRFHIDGGEKMRQRADELLGS